MTSNTGILSMLVNRARTLSGMFPEWFSGASTKHDHYNDFGWPEHLEFNRLYRMYERNGLATAAVDRTVEKVWQTHPSLLESEASDDETTLESDIRQRFSDLRFWQQLMEADTRSLVGKYAGVILRVADSKRFSEPVDSVPGGLEGLVEIIPAWEGQLRVSSWDTDELSENYGKPTMFQFQEASVGEEKQGHNRAFEVHPDRVVIFSKDGTVHGRSFLKPGFNDLIDIEKIKGSGGEGFWKNAKGGIALETDKEINIADMAKGMGVSVDELQEKMGDQVADFNKGLDTMLWLQGIQAKAMEVTLASPEHFALITLQSFAASIRMPMKILLGSQTGERASSEDADEWALTCTSHRVNRVIPGIMQVINRLERFRILPERDWNLDWEALTEATEEQKIERATKMADVNVKMRQSGEIVFTGEEIRATAGYEPLTDAEKYRDEPGAEDEDAAAGLDTEPPAAAAA